MRICKLRYAEEGRSEGVPLPCDAGRCSQLTFHLRGSPVFALTLGLVAVWELGQLAAGWDLFVCSLPCCFYDKITHTAVLKPSVCGNTLTFSHVHALCHCCIRTQCYWRKTKVKAKKDRHQSSIHYHHIFLSSGEKGTRRDEETVKRARRSLFSQEACSGNQQTFLKTCTSTGLRIELLRNQI